MYCILFFICLFAPLYAQTGEFNVLCSASFCEEYLNNEEEDPCSLQDICNKSELKSMLQLPSMVPCNCCDYCLEKIEEGGHCEVGEVGAANSLSLCGDGLFCHPDSATCVSMETTGRNCPTAQKEFDTKKEEGNLGHLEVRPNCDEHGFYKPYVCIPNEICYCVNKEGHRIFGTVPFTTLADLLLKCECSRSYDAAESFFDSNFHIVQAMRCQDNGDYDKIQCLDEENCYCVDPEDGAPTFPNIPSVPMTNISHSILPCLDNYDESEYYRICEKIYNEKLKEVADYKEIGIEVIDIQFPHCQLDGYYAAIQENEAYKYCADLDGSLLEKFEVPLSNTDLTESMNCNCARSRSILKGPDVVELPECLENGNYNPKQCRRGLCRCVDENGNQVLKEVGIDESLDCSVNQ